MNEGGDFHVRAIYSAQIACNQKLSDDRIAWGMDGFHVIKPAIHHQVGHVQMIRPIGLIQTRSCCGNALKQLPGTLFGGIERCALPGVDACNR